MNNISFDELNNMTVSVLSAEILELVSGGTETDPPPVPPTNWTVDVIDGD